MLEKLILKIDYGVSYGSVTLKALQNDNLPELDLLVREAIQNSSDAALNYPDKNVIVNFTVGTFDTHKFNSYLTGIREYMNERFPNESASFLEIRDSKTTGLTGEIKKAEMKNEDHGNFFKLIYDTGKKQTQSYAGGNWGFGKSVYYRVGMGIVVFYSKIATDTGYESRLIITLVEDESKIDANGNDATILNRLESRSAGKAWWGKLDGEDLLPIQEEDTIIQILDCFNVKPFNDDETGTSVIIPYINEDELLADIIPDDVNLTDDKKEHFVGVWASNVSDYLRLAVQKWYAPRLLNNKFKDWPGCNKKNLVVAINGQSISKNHILPFFKLVKELYNTALAKIYNDDFKSSEFENIECLPVNIKNYFEDGTTSGYVSIIKINKNTLNGEENLLNPYVYIGKYDYEGGVNEPIVMFARDPGMIIDYSVTGPWIKSIDSLDRQDEFLFAFFVPNTTKKLKSNLPISHTINTLGEYLRECEASDHMEWIDTAKVQIVSRIQKNTVNQIKKMLKAKSDAQIASTTSKLAAKVGKSLLPKIGYGKKFGNSNNGSSGAGGTGGTGGSGGNSSKKVRFRILNTSYTKSGMVMNFNLILKNPRKDATIHLLIGSEGNINISPDKWEKEIGTRFPVEISSVYIENIKLNTSEDIINVDKECSDNNTELSTEHFIMQLEGKSDTSGYTFTKVKSTVANIEINGKITIIATDRKYELAIDAV